MLFTLTSSPIDATLMDANLDSRSGAQVVFTGHVRNHNEGKQVLRLDYEAYPEMAVTEGNAIIREAIERFRIHGATAVHRTGSLKLGDMAIWICVQASHRDEAFHACRYILDTIKARVPIWKKEYYINENPVWVQCHHEH